MEQGSEGEEEEGGVAVEEAEVGSKGSWGRRRKAGDGDAGWEVVKERVVVGVSEGCEG